MNISDYNLFNLSIHSINILSMMIGMFIGGLMTRVRALAIVCIYLAILALALYLNQSMSLNFIH